MKQQSTKSGPTVVQGKGQNLSRSQRRRMQEVRWTTVHRTIALIVQWVRRWDNCSGIRGQIQNWILTPYYWYMPLPEGSWERWENLAVSASKYYPGITANDLYEQYRLMRLPSSQAEAQAVCAAADPQAYWDWYNEHPEGKRLYSPSRYTEYTIPHTSQN